MFSLLDLAKVDEKKTLLEDAKITGTVVDYSIKVYVPYTSKDMTIKFRILHIQSVKNEVIDCNLRTSGKPKQKVTW